MIDLIVIGAGAAGLASAIFAARRAPGLRVRCLDGARHLGAKILVSGGSRCNVTNRTVTERDFWGGAPRIVRQVLRAFPAAGAIAFFEELGVSLHEEQDGKLFPDTNRSRTVLDALLAEASRRGVVIETGSRVVSLTREDDAFCVRLGDDRTLRARHVVVATGGRSLPKTGSDGFGYELASRLGHHIVPTTPALAPLVLDDEWHAGLSGVAHPAEGSLSMTGARLKLHGDWLWTHFGASGPLALNLSRHWHRADIQGTHADVVLSLLAGETFEAVDEWIVDQSRRRPRAQIATVLAGRIPASVAAVSLQRAHVADDTPLAHLPRDQRRALVHALIAWPLRVRGSRGYQYAEVTAGGVSLADIEPATLESRVRAGLYFAGEILDVDGRLGGFNFQWAWSSGFVAGTAAARAAAGEQDRVS